MSSCATPDFSEKWKKEKKKKEGRKRFLWMESLFLSPFHWNHRQFERLFFFSSFLAYFYFFPNILIFKLSEMKTNRYYFKEKGSSPFSLPIFFPEESSITKRLNRTNFFFQPEIQLLWNSWSSRNVISSRLPVSVKFVKVCCIELEEGGVFKRIKRRKIKLVATPASQSIGEV